MVCAFGILQVFDDVETDAWKGFTHFRFVARSDGISLFNDLIHGEILVIPYDLAMFDGQFLVQVAGLTPSSFRI